MTLSGTVGDWSKVIPYSAAGQAWGRKGAGGGVKGEKKGLRSGNRRLESCGEWHGAGDVGQPSAERRLGAEEGQGESAVPEATRT